MERERDVDSLIMVLGFCERAKFEMRLVKEEVEFDGDCGVDGVVGDGANTLAKTVVQVVELEGVVSLLYSLLLEETLIHPVKEEFTGRKLGNA